MHKGPVFITCDGQIDTLWGLVTAKAALDIRGVSVCAGKLPGEASFQNLPGYLAMAGLGCKLYRGSARPVRLGAAVQWERFGPDGRCGLPLPDQTAAYEAGHAWDAIYREAKAAEGELTVLCFGPMTDLAVALFKYPDLPALLKKIAFVGGSYDYGNYTRVVEVNMAADPEAAAAVFRSRVPLEMYGFNAQRKSALSDGEIAVVTDGVKSTIASAFLMSTMAIPAGQPVWFGPALAAAGLIDERAVAFEKLNVFVELKGTQCRGRTTPLNMYTPLGYPKDTRLAMDVHMDVYVALLKTAFAQFDP